ncbi:hypothetical protein LC724_23800 [Blautia sp. RD014234]|nr:hypothetical protein [Blautia parvula]
MNILLIKRAKKHDKAAFQKLMEQQGPALYKAAKAILKNDEDVADAMQDTALTCWEKIDTLKKDEYFATWLTRILDQSLQFHLPAEEETGLRGIPAGGVGAG